MSFKKILKRFAKYGWILVLLLIVGGLISYNQSKKTNFISAINLGVGFGNGGDIQTDNSIAQLTPKLSTYLIGFFSSVTEQQKIISYIGFENNLVSDKKPFYSLVDSGLGYISINSSFESEKTALKFSEIVYKIFNEKVIPSWNSTHTTSMQIKSTSETNTSVFEVKKNLQSYILPLVISLFTGLALVFTIPTKIK